MRNKLALSLGLAVAALILPQMAMAAPVSAVSDGLRTTTVRDGGLLQDVQYRPYRGYRYNRWRYASRCTRIRNTCGARFGWRTWDARVCARKWGC